jgi:hypothetical protein
MAARLIFFLLGLLRPSTARAERMEVAGFFNDEVQEGARSTIAGAARSSSVIFVGCGVLAAALPAALRTELESSRFAADEDAGDRENQGSATS